MHTHVCTPRITLETVRKLRNGWRFTSLELFAGCLLLSRRLKKAFFNLLAVIYMVYVSTVVMGIVDYSFIPLDWFKVAVVRIGHFSTNNQF